MTDNFEISRSQRGKVNIIFHGNYYNFHSETNDGLIARYRCQRRTCKGYIILEVGQITNTGAHNHTPRTNIVQSRRRVKNIVRRGLETRETATNAIQTSLGEEIRNPDIINSLPMFDSLRDRITRTRRRALVAVDNSVQDIPDSLKTERAGNEFLRFDSGTEDENRFIIFIYQEKISTFSKSTTLLIDGTFRTVPRPFYQLLTIHSHYLSRTTPFIYVLMSKKTEESYIQVFSKIQEIIEIKPKQIITDFEKGLSNAASISFECTTNYCYFHFSKSIWRKIQEYGLTNAYMTNNEFRKIIKKILLTAFLEPSRVYDLYLTFESELLELRLNLTESIDNLTDYLRKMYFGSYNEQETWEEPRFSLECWSVYKRVRQGIPRTTNAAEGWYRGLNAVIRNAHPNIAQFINELLNKEEIDIYKFTQVKEGRIRCVNDYDKVELRIQAVVNSDDILDDETINNNLLSLIKFDFN